MPYKPIGKASVSRWVWVAVVFGLFAVALLWFLWNPIPGNTQAPRTEETPNAAWTTAPEGPRVKVDLPDTPVRSTADRRAEEAKSKESR